MSPHSYTLPHMRVKLLKILLNLSLLFQVVYCSCPSPRGSRPLPSQSSTQTILLPGSLLPPPLTALLDDGGHTMVQQITASITKDAVEDLGLAVGGPVTALVKSTEVMIGVE